MYQAIKNSRVVSFLSSGIITVICLILLFILTLWGTIYQVQNGLYPAQERFFNSLFFLVLNVIPFPGAQLVMWVMFVNLMAVTLFRFQYSWKRLGLLVSHFGILLFLVGAFVIHHHSIESHLTLWEGESSNVSTAYDDWELSIWKSDGNKHDVIAYDSKNFKAGQMLGLGKFHFGVYVKSFYPNCKAFSGGDNKSSNDVLNSSGVAMLQAVATEKDPGKNTPGGTFVIAKDNVLGANVLLYGEDENPTSVKMGDQDYFFMLRHKKYPLPFIVKLVDFRMSLHPGTQIAKSYESTVEIQTPQMSRQTVISMNNPLRYKDYTLYQSSYAIDEQKRESSTFSVVKNIGRLLPYIASFTTFFGVVIHYLMVFVFSLTTSKVTTRKRA